MSSFSINFKDDHICIHRAGIRDVHSGPQPSAGPKYTRVQWPERPQRSYFIKLAYSSLCILKCQPTLCQEREAPCPSGSLFTLSDSNFAPLYDSEQKIYENPKYFATHFTAECDEYIWILKYILHEDLCGHSFVSIIVTNIFEHLFVSFFWYEYIRTFVRFFFTNVTLCFIVFCINLLLLSVQSGKNCPAPGSHLHNIRLLQSSQTNKVCREDSGSRRIQTRK